jgi:hypothetical protein
MAEKHAMDSKEDDHEESETKEKAAQVANKGEHEVDAKQAEDHPYREWTEEALYEKAEAVGIEGYADMDKDDLINALRKY